MGPVSVYLCYVTCHSDPPPSDVYSYDEDMMVEDPNLAQHLAHFGINLAAMTKVFLCVTTRGRVCVCYNIVCTQTDQTMTELEIDMNMKIGEWSIIQESGKELQLVFGAGLTGMSNLGNR